MTDGPVALVVEDDPAIRLFAGDVLENRGFTVLAAASADEGLAVLQYHHEISLVLTDVVMPGTHDGLALVSEIRRRWPHKDLIVSSGLLPAEAAAGGGVFLAKPFDESDLLAALAQAQAAHA